MKISHLLLISLVLLAACKKEETSSPKTLSVTSVADNAVKPDTIPDKASFKIKLIKDSFNSDETDFVFNHNSSLAYIPNEDGLYFPGIGQASLSSISSDDRNLAINGLPYRQGMIIGLNVNTASEGAFVLEMSYTTKIPSTIHVWLRDTYLKDSVDIFKGNYNFNVIKSDANSFGSNRFKLVLKYLPQ